MEQFKAIYINPIYEKIPLTLGKTYLVFSSNKWGWQIVSDDGFIRTFNKKMFVKIEDWRTHQFEKLAL